MNFPERRGRLRRGGSLVEKDALSDAERGKHKTMSICQQLDVSGSPFYAWRARPRTSSDTVRCENFRVVAQEIYYKYSADMDAYGISLRLISRGIGLGGIGC